MSKIIAIANQKGGVGKTTTATNLCAGLKLAGKSVLIIDCDAQGNASTGMGDLKNKTPGIYDMLMNRVPAYECIIKTDYGDVIPSGSSLSGVSMQLAVVDKREYVMRDALKCLYSDYDYILLDCPPSLELLTINCFTAADSIIIPMQCEYYALEGIADLIHTVKLTNKKLNPRLQIEGIVLTMYDKRANLTNQVENELRKFLGDKVYTTNIPRNVKLSEAPSHHVPGIVYDKYGKGSKAYLDMVDEFLRKQ